MSHSANEAAREVLDAVPLVMRAIRADVRRHRSADLSIPQFRALAYLNRRAGASLSDLAEHIGLTLPSMSKLVDGLVARKLVTRREHAGDRRRVTLALTPRGYSTLQAALESTQKYLAGRLAKLPERQRATVIEAMQILRPLFTFQRDSETALIQD